MSCLIARSLIASAILVSAICLLMPNAANAHSRMLSPAARWAGYCSLNVKCPTCGWKNASDANPSAITYTRGQNINVQWARNNHPGGFVQLSIVPYTKYGSNENWNNINANVVQFSCAESQCKSGTADPLGPDAPGTPEDGNVCTTNFKIPSHLADGQYTLSWSWQNTRSYYGDINKGLTTYTGCHDFTIKGGSRITRRGRCPAMALGDSFSKSNRKCGFYGPTSGNPSNPLWCTGDGCAGKAYVGAPTGYENCS